MFGELQEPTVGIALYCIVAYIIMSLIGYGMVPYSKPQGKNGRFIFLIAILLFAATYAVDSDFFSYKELLSWTIGMDVPHLEGVYGFFYVLAGRHYFIFRLIVWGLAFFFVGRISRMVKIQPYFTIFFLMFCYGPIFSYARASLAMAIFFLGLVMILNSQKKFSKVCWGILIMCSSYFFHQSILMVLPLVVYCLLPVNKKIFIFALLLIPMAIFALRELLNTIMDVSSNIDGAEDLAYSMSFYSNQETASMNWKGWIRFFIQLMLFFVPFAMLPHKQIRKGEFPTWIEGLYKISLALFVFAFSTFLLEFQGSVLFIRFIYFLQIPISLICSYYFQKRIFSRKKFKLSFFLLMSIQVMVLVTYIFKLA